MIRIKSGKRTAKHPAIEVVAGTQSVQEHSINTPTATSETRDVKFHTAQMQSESSANDATRVPKPVEELRSLLNGIREVGEEFRGLQGTLKDSENTSKQYLETEKKSIGFFLQCLEEHRRQGSYGRMYYEIKDGQVVREVYLGSLSVSCYLEMKMENEEELRRIERELGELIEA